MLSKHLSERHFSLILFGGSLLFYIFVVIGFHTPQTNDFAVQIEAARNFMAGNAEAFHTEYFEKWPDLPNYAPIEVALLSICDADIFIQIFQAVCMSVTLLFVYKLLIMFVDFRVASISSMLLAFLPIFVLTVGSTTNQILSATLTLAAVYCFCYIRRGSFLLNRKIAGYVTCGILLAVARFVRPDAVLVEAALLIVLIVSRNERLGKGPSGKGYWKIAAISGLLLSYLLVGSMLTGGLYGSGVYSDRATGENVTFNKLLSGTDLESRGRVSSYYITENEKRAERDGVSYNTAVLETLLERAESPGYVLALEIEKAKTLWWNDPFTHCLYDSHPSTQEFAYDVHKACTILLISVNLIALGARRAKRRIPDVYLVALVVLALTFCAYALIEVQPRYLYFAHIVMLITGAPGLEWLLAKIPALGDKERRRVAKLF